jgi:hypothetical protein
MLRYSYKMTGIDKRKLAVAAGYENSAQNKTCDTAVDQCILDSDLDMRREYRQKFGAVTYYGPDCPYGKWVFVSDMLQEIGIALEIEDDDACETCAGDKRVPTGKWKDDGWPEWKWCGKCGGTGVKGNEK